ncbi:MAG: EamA family transporter, partial [Candidatus Coatesbacteria bacterium]|nr:EamA family transporter [Candidatus Coatesbacteria bacterium]
YSPTVILMAYFALDEKIGLLDIIGAGIIVLSIAFCTVKAEGEQTFNRKRLTGLVLGFASLISTALGVIIMKPALARVSLMWAMEIRLLAAIAGLAVLALIGKNRKATFAALRPSMNWKYMLPGAALGGYIAGIFWTAGFKLAAVGGAAILAQVNVLFIAAFARIFLKEPLSAGKAMKLGIALVGALVVAIF